MQLTPATLEEVTALLLSGHCYQAYNRMEPYPLNWEHLLDGEMSARMKLLHRLGGFRATNAFLLRAWRRYQHRPEAIVNYCQHLCERGRSWEALQLLESTLAGITPGSGYENALRCMIAQVYSGYRDFTKARENLAIVRSTGQEHSWVTIIEAGICEKQDRYEAALELTAATIQEAPGYGSAICYQAHLLQLLGRNEEALEMLRAATARLEFVLVPMTLQHLEFELGLYDAARATVQTCVKQAPLADRGFQQWTHTRLAELAGVTGQYATAREEALHVKDPYFRILAENIAGATPSAERRKLPVSFVRQHQFTCVPATVSALATYMGQPIDHLTMAREVCYDGTPKSAERAWLEQRGWCVREFSLTPEVVKLLIDAGLPFALTTNALNIAHMQAVIGYDETKGTLIIRDPYMRYCSEWLFKQTLSRYGAIGLRGMVILPACRVAEFAALELPDESLRDSIYQFRQHLLHYQRDEAERVLETITASQPEHWLTLMARLELAFFDNRRSGVMEIIDELIKRFPDNDQLLDWKLATLNMLGRQGAYIQELEAIAAKPMAAPGFLARLAFSIARDNRQLHRAETLVMRALHTQPGKGQYLTTLGNIRWHQSRFDDYLKLYRLAACSEEMDEDFSMQYLYAARGVGRGEQALAHLHERIATLAARSRSPVVSLHEALVISAQQAAADDLLFNWLAKLPQDENLLRHAARDYARRGDFATASGYLENVRGKVHPITHAQLAAEIAHMGGRLENALQHTQTLLEQSPLHTQAIEECASLLSKLHGVPRAIAFYRERCETFPHDYNLKRSYLGWLRTHDDVEYLRVLEIILEECPTDTWSLREKAIYWTDRKELAKAEAIVDTLLELEPRNPLNVNLAGLLQEAREKLPEAREAFRKAIRLDVDIPSPIHNLFRLCTCREERIDALELLKKEITTQVNTGTGMVCLGQYGVRLLPPAEMESFLVTLCEKRPDLWQTWQLRIDNLTREGRADEALSLSADAVARFPHTGPLLRQRAELLRTTPARQEMIALFEHARAVDRNNRDAHRFLFDLYQQDGNHEASRTVLEELLRIEPYHPINHRMMAQWLSSNGRFAEASQRLLQAIRLDPAYEPAVDTLLERHDAQGKIDEALAMLLQLVKESPSIVRHRLNYTQALMFTKRYPEAIKEIDSCMAQAPADMDVVELRSRLFCMLGQATAALSYCESVPVAIADRKRLLLLKATILTQSKQVDAAIKLLHDYMQSDPLEVTILRRLVELYRQSEQATQYYEAARQLVSMCPDFSVAHGFLGDASERVKKIPEARNAYRQALQLDPDYPFVRNRLFALAIAASEWAEADALLIQMKRMDGPETYHGQCALYWAERADYKKAADELMLLFILPAWNSDNPYYVLNQFREKHSDLSYVDFLTRLAQDRRSLPRIARDWVKRMIKVHGNSYATKQVKALPLAWPERVDAESALIENIAAKQSFFRFLLFMLWHDKRYAQVTRLWASYGYALLQNNWNRLALKWLSDWQTRPDVKPYTLWNYGLLLIYLKKFDLLEPVFQQLDQMAPDHTFHDHLVRVALFREPGKLSPHLLHQLQQLTYDSTEQHERLCRDMALLRLELLGYGPADRKQALTLYKRLRKTVSSVPKATANKYTFSCARKLLNDIHAHTPSLWRVVWQRFLWIRS